METENSSRRGFLKTVAVTTAAVAASGAVPAHLAAAPGVDRKTVVAVLGDTLIPSEPGDPGYKDLESHGITDEVLKALPGVSDADVELFNEKSKEKFGGKSFLDLSGAQRAEYLHQIIAGSAGSDAKEKETLQRVYRNTRRRVMTLYYSNFPEHQWPRGKDGFPIPKPGDLHQIMNPNTKQLVTAWDQVGYPGPLTWEEEERRRNVVKKIHWHENWSPIDYQAETPKKG